MKSIFWKKRLEKELSYPKLTAKANRRFDEILGRLPEREASPQRTEPAHFAKPKNHRYQAKPIQEDTEELVFLNVVPQRRWPSAVAGTVMSLVVLFFLSLVMLNVIRPDVAETLPALGGFFQAWNHRGESSELPPDSSVPESRQETVLSVEYAYTSAQYLFLSLRLDTGDPELLQAYWLTNSIPGLEGEGENAFVIVDGQYLNFYQELVLEKVDDHFEGALTAILPREAVDSESWEGSLAITSLFGMKEQQEPSAYEGTEWDSEMLLVLEQELSVSFQTSCQEPEGRNGQWDIEYLQHLDYFSNHFGLYDDLRAEHVGDPYSPYAYARQTIFSDMDVDLPVDAVVWIDGAEWLRIPLRLSGAKMEDSAYYDVLGEDYELMISRVPKENTSPPHASRRVYQLNVMISGAEADFWETRSIQILLQSRLTGETFAASEVVGGYPQSGYSAPSPAPTPEPQGEEHGGTDDPLPEEETPNSAVSSQPEGEPPKPDASPSPEDVEDETSPESGLSGTMLVDPPEVDLPRAGLPGE